MCAKKKKRVKKECECIYKVILYREDFSAEVGIEKRTE